MANTAQKISELTEVGSASSNSLVVVVRPSPADPRTVSMKVNNLLANAETLSSANIVFKDKSTPANATITVAGGTMWFDDDYIYVATSNNTVKRAALTTF